MSNPVIRAEIDARLAEHHMNADEVLARLATMARGDVSVFLDAAGNVDLTTDAARENMYLLKKARTKTGTTKSGEPWTEREIELHDPQSALVHVGRYHKLFTDKLEASVSPEARDLLTRYYDSLGVKKPETPTGK